jgi:EAL domain-containing protein (putative c-di-GMP-specific phosphodiesterase class I)
MQGYYFSRPVAADEFRALVDAEHENVARIA